MNQNSLGYTAFLGKYIILYEWESGLRARDHAVPAREVDRLHSNFNYVLTFEMTSNSYEGRKHGTVNSEVSGYNGT